jgi:hypothetical protein
MTDTTIAAQRQKAVQAWVKLRAKREAEAAAKPLKHGKKSGK